MKHYLFEGLDRYMRDLKNGNNKKIKSYRNKLNEDLDKSVNNLKEALGKKKLLAFDHFDPGYLYLIDNLTNNQFNELQNTIINSNNWYSDDVSDLKGLWIVGNNDESFSFYSGEKFSTPKEWNDAIYNNVINQIENSEDDWIYIDLIPGDDDSVYTSEERENINPEDYKEYINTIIEDSYVDNDSSSALYLVNFTPSGAKAVSGYLSPIIVTYKEFIDNYSDEEIELTIDNFENWPSKYVDKYVDESLNEDTVKRDGKWVNVGKDGKANSGKFTTKKEADAQRRAMFANGYKGESLEEETNMDKINKYLKSIKEKPITEDKEEEELTNMEMIARILKGKPLPPSRKRIEEPQEPTPVKGPIRDKDGKTNMDKITSLLGESKSNNTKSMNLYESINRGFERLYGDLDSTKPVVSRKQLTEAKSKKYPIKDFLTSHIKDVSAILNNRGMFERDMKKAIVDLLRSSDIPSTQIDKFEYELNNSRNWISTLGTYLTSLKVDNSSKSKNESKEVNKKSLKEYKDLGQDLGEYQKYVDADMKEHGHISKKTMEEIKKAGLSVVKDQYGEYEVIAKEKDHLAKSKNESKKPAPKKKSREEIVEAYRRNLRKRKLAEAMARKREERKNK